MKPRIGIMPSAYKKAHQNLQRFALEICGEVTHDNSELIAHSFSEYLQKTPDLDIHGGESARDRYFSALGQVYGMVLEHSFGWERCWLTFARDQYDPEEGVKSVVSPDHCYFVTPIALVRMEFFQKKNITGLLYDKIKACDLPKVKPGDFLELKI